MLSSVARAELPGPDPNQETADLLNRWHTGDQQALAELLERDMPWIREHVSKRLGPLLRRVNETQDIVQDAVVEVLRYGPRFLLQNHAHFRALIAKIVENELRMEHERLTAKKRDLRKEHGMPSAMSAISLDPDLKSPTQPDQAAERNEMQNWMRLALEFLDPEDRRVILLHEWEGATFTEIGKELGIGENGARMKFNRALPKLAKKVEALKAGMLASMLDERRPGSG